MLIDGHGRTVDYLRISVTDRCNFRCAYCMSEKPFSWVPHSDILSYEDMFLFVKIAIDEGVRKIRMTGGEPLLRPDVDIFIKMIKDYRSDVDIALTTNGYFLANFAKKLVQAGLKRVNVSLDSLKKETIYKISKIDALDKILLGIDESLKCGLRLKLNVVPLKGINDGEILDLFEYARKKEIMIRFIEYMENSFANKHINGLSSNHIQNIISSRYTFKERLKIDASPARLFELEDGYSFGIIEPHKRDFCENCNRVRLTSEGFVIPCLYFDEAMSIKEAIRSKNITKAADILRNVLKNKPKENRWNEGENSEISSRAFYQTGG